MKKGNCAFCGKFGPVTREHFVAKGLWAGPRPNRSLTVPTCFDCNNGASDDDQYFRNVMAIVHDTDHPEAKKVFEGPMKRSFGYDPTLLKELLKGRGVAPYFTPSGLLLGNKPFLTVDDRRMNRILCKIVLGLFYVARGHAMPDTHAVYICASPDKEMLKMCLSMTQSMCPEQCFGDDVFVWRFCGDAEDQNLTYWMLAFYKKVVFFGATLPEKDDLVPKQEKVTSSILILP